MRETDIGSFERAQQKVLDQTKRAQNKYTDEVARAEDNLSDLLDIETSEKPTVKFHARACGHAQDTHHATFTIEYLSACNTPIRWRALRTTSAIFSRPAIS